MHDNEEEKKNKKEKDTDTEISTCISYTDDNAVKNGEFSAIKLPVECTVNVTNTTNSSSEEYHYKDGNYTFGLNNLKEIYNTNHSVSETYAYLKNYINSNKDNPELLRDAISSLLGDFSKQYDNNIEYTDLCVNQTEALEKILNIKDGEQLPGFICSTIHEFIMNTLNECGINAVLVVGDTDGAHATLLYQLEDGKYIWNNYDNLITIEANNIKDALREVHKNSGSLASGGYLTVISRENGKYKSYQEFAYKEEAVFGKEMDKRDYNSITPFDRNILSNNQINTNIDISGQGNISAEVGGVFVPKENMNVDIDLGFKKNNETSMAHNSTSVGIKAEVKEERPSGLFYSAKGIVDYIKMNIGQKYDNTAFGQCEEINNILGQMFNLDYRKDISQALLFLNANVGKADNLLNKSGLSLENRYKAGVIGGCVFNTQNPEKPLVGGDARITLEDGIELSKKTNNTNLSFIANAGLVTDLVLTSGKQIPNASFGGKANIGLNTVSKINDNIFLGGNVSGYTVQMPVSRDYGVGANIFGAYKSPNTNVTYNGSVGCNWENQYLNIGGFKEQTENNMTYNASFGAQYKNHNWSISASHKTDALNSTRNQSNITLNYKINF